MSKKNCNDLEILIRARYPIIYIVSWEEERVEEAMKTIAFHLKKNLLIWTSTKGFTRAETLIQNSTRDPAYALSFILNAPDHTLFVLKDFHPYMDALATRMLRDIASTLRNSFKTVILLSPTLHLPQELEKDVTVIDFDIPDYNELAEILEQILLSVKDKPEIQTDITPLDKEALIKAAQGLTAVEAKDVFAKSLVETRKLDINSILTQKEQIIRKSGILEYFPAEEEIGNVGGMDYMKTWLEKRSSSFTQKARDFGLPEPKGVLLLGVQGCGKSLLAKAISALWKLPLLRMDVGRIFAGYVGASEENMRHSLSVAESVSPCILWLDELEKGLSGIQSSGSTDSGTTARVFSTFLTWLQEKKAPVFVVATANSIDNLPPELLRKGRFDEIFFIDLPAIQEREEIFKIHLLKRHRNPDQFNLQQLGIVTAGYSGAEIEQAVIEALYNAYGEGRDITTEDILNACSASVPMAMTMREKISEMRNWALTRARKASSAVPEGMEEMEVMAIKNRNNPSTFRNINN